MSKPTPRYDALRARREAQIEIEEARQKAAEKKSKPSKRLTTKPNKETSNERSS